MLKEFILLFVDNVLKNVLVVTTGPRAVEKLERLVNKNGVETVDIPTMVDTTLLFCITGPRLVEKVENVLFI